MPPLFQPVRTTQAQLELASTFDGKVYFVEDTEKLFFDYSGERVEIREIIILDLESARTDLLAPKNKFYFILETGLLWLYRNGTWIKVTSDSGIKLFSQSFSAGSSISSVVLDEEIEDESCIVSVNVDNTFLLRSTYSLGEDLKTITFSEAIDSELGIDVVYSTKAESSGTSSPAEPTAVTFLQTLNSRSPASSTERSISLTPGSTYQLNLTGHTNIVFENWIEGSDSDIRLYLNVPDSYTLTLPSNIKWKNGSAPELEVDATYILEFKSIDGGNIIYGSIDQYM